MLWSLPQDSATVRAELGADSLWGLSEHLLAVLAEVVDQQTRWLVSLSADQKNSQARKFLKSKPLQIPRPGVEAGNRKWQNRKGTRLGELVGMMDGKAEV